VSQFRKWLDGRPVGIISSSMSDAGRLPLTCRGVLSRIFAESFPSADSKPAAATDEGMIQRFHS